MPVVAVFAMGRTGSSGLEAKLCDLFKRPAAACVNGKYAVSHTLGSALWCIVRAGFDRSLGEHTQHAAGGRLVVGRILVSTG